MATAKPYHIYPGFAFVAYPNRDSTLYKERYDIPEAQTIIRGTLRYAGFPDFVKVLVDIGFLSDEKQNFLEKGVAWNDVTQKIVGASSSSEEDLAQAITSKTTFRNTEQKNQLLADLKWLGLFSSEEIIPRGNPLDTLCATLEKKMQFGEGERDLVMLQHRFEVQLKDGTKQTRLSTLCEYGNPSGYSAMAKLVGVPCACAVKKIFDGSISEKGVLAPMNSKINNPLMDELKKYGISMVEETIT